MQSSFFSMVLRMKYVNRWGLMRNTHTESLSEHTADVAILAHALAVIARRRFGREVNPERAAVLALYHDACEIITGDLPTPVKYHDERITAAYKRIEAEANRSLLAMLPADLREEYEPLLTLRGEDTYLMQLVKAADKLSALIKCEEEERSGNREFTRAKQGLLDALEGMQLPEVGVFMAEFYDSFAKTLDEQ
jgi:5'-deoxynucleotidase